jgi:hypothetical protein
MKQEKTICCFVLGTFGIEKILLKVTLTFWMQLINHDKKMSRRKTEEKNLTLSSMKRASCRWAGTLNDRKIGVYGSRKRMKTPSKSSSRLRMQKTFQ